MADLSDETPPPDGGDYGFTDMSMVLEEEIDPDYSPSDEEVLEYARWLGMDVDVDSSDRELLWVAREGLIAPLPKNWKPCKTKDTEDIYYFNFSTGESTWDHPCDGYYKSLYAEEKKKLQQKTSEAVKDKDKDKDREKEKKRRKGSVTSSGDIGPAATTAAAATTAVTAGGLAPLGRKPLPGPLPGIGTSSTASTAEAAAAVGPAKKSQSRLTSRLKEALDPATVVAAAASADDWDTASTGSTDGGGRARRCGSFSGSGEFKAANDEGAPQKGSDAEVTSLRARAQGLEADVEQKTVAMYRLKEQLAAAEKRADKEAARADGLEEELSEVEVASRRDVDKAKGRAKALAGERDDLLEEVDALRTKLADIKAAAAAAATMAATAAMAAPDDVAGMRARAAGLEEELGRARTAAKADADALETARIELGAARQQQRQAEDDAATARGAAAAADALLAEARARCDGVEADLQVLRDDAAGWRDGTARAQRRAEELEVEAAAAKAAKAAVEQLLQAAGDDGDDSDGRNGRNDGGTAASLVAQVAELTASAAQKDAAVAALSERLALLEAAAADADGQIADAAATAQAAAAAKDAALAEVAALRRRGDERDAECAALRQAVARLSEDTAARADAAAAAFATTTASKEEAADRRYQLAAAELVALRLEVARLPALETVLAEASRELEGLRPAAAERDASVRAAAALGQEITSLQAQLAHARAEAAALARLAAPSSSPSPVCPAEAGPSLAQAEAQAEAARLALDVANDRVASLQRQNAALALEVAHQQALHTAAAGRTDALTREAADWRGRYLANQEEVARLLVDATGMVKGAAEPAAEAAEALAALAALAAARRQAEAAEGERDAFRRAAEALQASLRRQEEELARLRPPAAAAAPPPPPQRQQVPGGDGAAADGREDECGPEATHAADMCELWARVMATRAPLTARTQAHKSPTQPPAAALTTNTADAAGAAGGRGAVPRDADAWATKVAKERQFIEALQGILRDEKTAVRRDQESLGRRRDAWRVRKRGVGPGAPHHLRARLKAQSDELNAQTMRLNGAVEQTRRMAAWVAERRRKVEALEAQLRTLPDGVCGGRHPAHAAPAATAAGVDVTFQAMERLGREMDSEAEVTMMNLTTALAVPTDKTTPGRGGGWACGSDDDQDGWLFRDADRDPQPPRRGGFSRGRSPKYETHQLLVHDAYEGGGPRAPPPPPAQPPAYAPAPYPYHHQPPPPAAYGFVAAPHYAYAYGHGPYEAPMPYHHAKGGSAVGHDHRRSLHDITNRR